MKSENSSETENPNLKSKSRVLSSQELFKGTREVLIEHEHEQYRLIITKAGKLVLNK